MPKKITPSATIDFPFLAADATLLSIATYAIDGTRYQSTPGDDAEFDSALSLEMGARDDGKGFRVRIRCDVTHGDATAGVDVGAEYELQKAVYTDIPQDALVQFVNDVSVMQLVPYIRQGIADVTQRLWDDAVTLPVMQRGQMIFSPSDYKVPAELTGSEQH